MPITIENKIVLIGQTPIDTLPDNANGEIEQYLQNHPEEADRIIRSLCQKYAMGYNLMTPEEYNQTLTRDIT